MPRESEFTPANEWCPEPELWESHDPNSTERDVTELVAALVRATKPRLALETGTGYGYTAEAIGRALDANGRGRLITVEPNAECVAIARKRCHGLPVEVIQCDAASWSPAQGESIDFAWIDSHIRRRYQELRRLRSHFAPGAIIGIHDVAPQHPVHDLLRNLERQLKWPRIQLRTPRGVTFLQVPLVTAGI